MLLHLGHCKDRMQCEGEVNPPGATPPVVRSALDTYRCIDVSLLLDANQLQYQYHDDGDGNPRVEI